MLRSDSTMEQEEAGATATNNSSSNKTDDVVDLEKNESMVSVELDHNNIGNKEPALPDSFLRRGSQHDAKELSFAEVNMTVKNKKGEVVKDILKDVWGFARPGETTAIMGASGAGKTSLFNILAGRVRSKGKIHVSAKIRLGGHKIDPNQNMNVRTMFGFVSQDDSLHAPSTPRESFRFSAKLRLPKTTSDESIDHMVETLIKELGLTSAADTMIGDVLKKGISGGERRRTSIGVELVSRPPIIFLDEPTSGLDSFAAKQVMNLLEAVAEAGNVVLFTIHQPSSKIFGTFDRLLLLHQGRSMYNDYTKSIAEDFEKMGYPVPLHYNTADWILDVAQGTDIKELETAGFFEEDPREPMDDKALDLVVPKNTRHASIGTELKLLMFREYVQVARKPAVLLINCFITAFLGIIFGVIFLGVGEEPRTSFSIIQAQLGALVNVLISTMMGQAQPALLVFGQERPLFLREYSTDHYKVFTYFVSHLVTEACTAMLLSVLQALIVFWMIGFQQTFAQFVGVTFALSITATAVAVMLGAMASDVKFAASLFTLVVVPQFYFSGVFISTELIPAWVRWAQYLCSLFYAARLAFIYEFGDCNPGIEQENCDRILQQNGVNKDDKWWYWLAMAGLFVLFRSLSMLILRQKGRTFS